MQIWLLQTSGASINSYTYKGAGVDIDAGAETVAAIRPLAAATRRPGAEAEIGAFAGLFDLKAAGFEDPLLLAATDGVGSKLEIAIRSGRHDSIGIDLVAMCVNDLVVQGAEPLFFLDYFATGRLAPEVATEVVRGIAEGCRTAGAALIGGETAEMPGFYREGDYDVAGFAVGAVERGALLSGAEIAAGDVLLGLEASGLHANGFSLVRRLVADLGLDYEAAAPFEPEQSLSEALLTPTRIYVKSCLAAHRAGVLKGLAHITGGGLLENLPRVLPEGLQGIVDGATWRPPPVFGWLSAQGGIAAAEMARTFNCGLGMVAVVGSDAVEAATEILGQAGERVHVVGAVRERAAEAPAAIVEGLGVVSSGRGSNQQALIEACGEAGYPAEIGLVISNEPGAQGLVRAAAAGIPQRTVEHRDFDGRPAFEAALTAALRAADVELVCLAGFMRLLTDSFLDAWRDRVVNIHPSLLPAFKGLDVHQRVLAAGVRISGCTVHFVVPAMDSGPIIAQAAVPVAADDTADSLAARVLAAEHRLYPLALRLVAEGRTRLEGGIVRIEGRGALGATLLNPPDC